MCNTDGRRTAQDSEHQDRSARVLHPDVGDKSGSLVRTAFSTGKPPPFDGGEKPRSADENSMLKAIVGNMSRKALVGMNDVECGQEAVDNRDVRRRVATVSSGSSVVRMRSKRIGDERANIIPRIWVNTHARLEFDFGSEPDFSDRWTSFDFMIEKQQREDS